MIRRWSTPYLSENGNDYWVEWTGEDFVTLYSDESEVKRFPLGDDDIDSEVGVILGTLEKSLQEPAAETVPVVERKVGSGLPVLDALMRETFGS